MDDDERGLFAVAVVQALRAGSLDGLGWEDALAHDERSAVSLLFEAQGRLLVTSDALRVLTGGGAPSGRAAIDPDVELFAIPDSGVTPGRRALAHELVGVSRAMLDLARTHALEREQFGGPIAGFQAVRHRLAEAHVAVEAAAAAADAAWADGSQLGAALAKSVAGRSAKIVARHAQQVLAGIGFTAEHPFHRLYKRVLVLDRVLGDSTTLTREIGQQLIADRVLPDLLPL